MLLISNQAPIPSGSMCGAGTIYPLAETGEMHLSPGIDCQGQSLVNGCPSGYYMRSVYSSSASQNIVGTYSGTHFVSCIKS